MSMFNTINITGNVVKDPMIGSSDKEFAVVRIACNTGKKENNEVLYIDIKLFGGAYRDLKNYDIKKGDRVTINGTLKSSDYEDKSGVKRTSYAIHADYILKISGKLSSEGVEPSEPESENAF